MTLLKVLKKLHKFSDIIESVTYDGSTSDFIVSVSIKSKDELVNCDILLSDHSDEIDFCNFKVFYTDDQMEEARSIFLSYEDISILKDIAEAWIGRKK